MRAKVLFVLPWLPYPMISGGHQAIFNGIKAIAGVSDIYITYDASFGDSTEKEKNDLIAQIGECTILPFVSQSSKTELVKRPWYSLVLSKYKTLRHGIKLLIKSLLHITAQGTPAQAVSEYKGWLNVLYPFHDSFALFVRDIVERNHIDVVQCEMIRNASIVFFLPENVKKVFVHHELRTVRYSLESEGMEGSNVAKKAYLDFFQINETGVLNKYDAIITLSEIDKEKLRVQGVTVPIYPSFPIVNTEINRKPRSLDPHLLSFIGNDGHSPNLVGIRWFLEECWNDLLSFDSKYHLQIVGQWSNPVIEELSQQFKNVSFTGYVDDLKKTIEGTIMIVPITVGSGIRMKILEAANIGCPIVSTSVGAEGIPFETEIHCLIADNPGDFNNAIIKLNDPGLAQGMVNNAQFIMDEFFSESKLKETRTEIYAKVLDVN